MASDNRRDPEYARARPRVDPDTGDRIDPGERFIEQRSWFDRSRDEVTSWFGNPEAARRRQLDQAAGDHFGKGPKTYKRPDQRILEEVSERLAESHDLDASDIIVTVDNAEVILTGSVRIRADKHLAEDITETVRGITHIQNNLRVGAGV